MRREFNEASNDVDGDSESHMTIQLTPSLEQNLVACGAYSTEYIVWKTT